jgi:hypothetical protein
MAKTNKIMAVTDASVFAVAGQVESASHLEVNGSKLQFKAAL